MPMVEVVSLVLAFSLAPILRSCLGSNLVLALGFLVSTFEWLLRLFHRMHYSLNTYVSVVVWIGLACVRLLALAQCFALDGEV